MAEFASGPTRRIPAAADDPRSQEMTLFVGMPLVCWKSKKEKTKVILANSKMWLASEGEGSLGGGERSTLGCHHGRQSSRRTAGIRTPHGGH